MRNEIEAKCQMHYLKGMLSTLTKYVDYTDLARNQKETEDKVNEIINNVIKALTPPTSDAVCKALSEYLKEGGLNYWLKVKYIKDEGFYQTDGETKLPIMYEIRHKNILHLNNSRDLPPRLIILIGRFYEAQEGEMK